MRLTAHTVLAPFSAHGSSMSSFVGFSQLCGLPSHFRVDLLMAVEMYNDQVVPCVRATYVPWDFVMLLRFFHHGDRSFGQVIHDAFSAVGA